MAAAAPSDLKIGFLGAGMMATALMDGLISKGVVAADAISCSDPWDKARERASAKGIHATESNADVVQRSNVVVIAVKPGVVAAACADIAAVANDALVISIAAGVTLASLEGALNAGRRVVRVMPNTPCLVGMAAAAFALGSTATPADKEATSLIFGAVGLALEMPEGNLDAVTGLSGSGPAYVYQFIEALSDGGVRAGLPRAVATQLAAQTVKGAAEMVLATGQHPGALKDQVTSPGGTTIAGVDALEAGGLRTATINAVKAATKRSKQLGGEDDATIANKYNL